MCIHDDLARALDTLEMLGAPGQHDFLVMAALETNGFFKLPERANNWDTQMVEIKAHGIFADGCDASEAIRNWRLAAGWQVNIQRQIQRAEYVLRQPKGHNVDDVIRKACKTILTDGRVESIRVAARITLADLDAIA
ncbi:MAG: hypothetical protein ACI92Z_003613 [Paracoccaceae bacterium]|jgi:hypothetical protein